MSTGEGPARLDLIGFLRRVHAVVRRLYPRRVRLREGDEIRGILERLSSEARDDRERRRLLGRAIRDAVRTLPGAWGREWRRVWRRPSTWEVGMGSSGQDVRFALRNVRRRPVFAAVAVLTLGIALGANAAVYAVAEATVFRALPYRAPERVVEVRGNTDYVREMTDDGGWRVTADFQETPGVRSAGVYVSGGGTNLVGVDGASRVSLAHVSENFFEVLGVDLALGAGFPRDGASPNTVVISRRVWENGFARDPDVLGRTIELGGTGFLVVGVAPAGVTFPGGTDLWVTQPLKYDFLTGAVAPTFVARLAEGAARSDVEAILRERTPEDDRDAVAGFRGPPPPSLVPLRDALVEEVRTPLRILAVAAGLVLLLGTLNLAGVTVSQYLQRDRELRVRLALGARRARVLRQLLVETVVIGVMGAGLAVALAAGGVRVLASGLPGEIYGLDGARIGPASILVIAALAVATSLLIGLLPAQQAVGHDPNPTRTGRATQSRRQVRLQSALVVGQVTIALVLLTGAALLGRSLAALLAVPMGIDTEHVLTAEVHLGTAAYPEVGDRRAYLTRAIETLASIPGVTAVGATSMLPLDDGMGIGFGVKTPDEPEDTRRFARWLGATPGYFEAIGTPLLLGRTFSETSSPGDEVILSREAAMDLAGTVDLVGRTIDLRIGLDAWEPATVVGVAEDVLDGGPEDAPSPVVYQRMTARTGLGFAVRTGGDPAALARELDRRLRVIDPATPPFSVRTTDQALARELASRRALASVSSFFGLLAVVLSGIGIYGLMAQSVVRRRREIGIRMALGAAVGSMVTMVIRRGLLLALAGVVIGIPVALGMAGMLGELLFEVSVTDPAILIGTPVFLSAVAVLASWLPARRASVVDPVEVLGAE